MTGRMSDFYPGLVFDSEPLLLTEEMLSDFDMMWAGDGVADDDLVGLSKDSSRDVSVWQLCAIAQGLASKVALAGPELKGAPDISEVCAANPAKAGDEVSLKATVLRVQDPSSAEKPCNLFWRWQLFTQRGDEVLNLVASSSFALLPR